MDYRLCVSICLSACVFLCSHDNDTKCSDAKSQPQWMSANGLSSHLGRVNRYLLLEPMGPFVACGYSYSFC